MIKCMSVFSIDAKKTHRLLNLGMPKPDSDRSNVLHAFASYRMLGSTFLVRSVPSWAKADRLNPLINQTSVLWRAEMPLVIDVALEI